MNEGTMTTGTTRETSLRVTVAQMHSVAGDLAGNTARAIQALNRAVADSADIVVYPEMALTGYPVEDLLGDDGFMADAEDALSEFAAHVPDTIVALVGVAVRTCSVPPLGGANLPSPVVLDASVRTRRNIVAVVSDGRVIAAHAKTLLPTYGVFDDSRWVEAGPLGQDLIDVRGVPVGLAICEDVWTRDVAEDAVNRGAALLIAVNASPYAIGKATAREAMLADLARDLDTQVLFVNAVGGQDEVVYDGTSALIHPLAGVTWRAPRFVEVDTSIDVTGLTAGWVAGAVPTLTQPVPERGPVAGVSVGAEPLNDGLESMWKALETGVRDYVHGNGFTAVLVGLSGGLDSAVAATLACDALGPANVRGVGMPGPYSSDGSVTDARDLATNLGIQFDVISIRSTYDAEEALISPYIDGAPGAAVARENIQARLRALHLMTIANAHGLLLLNTGNRSESAVGYFTLGGDSSGGFAPLRDLPKVTLYELATWRNAASGSELIPRSTIEKPPSAELAPDQRDTDSLPPYPVLDAILRAYLEDMLSATAIVDRWLEQRWTEDSRDVAAGTVVRVLTMTDRAEHKRRQVAPGVKVTSRAFGKDRRMPITSGRVHRDVGAYD
jgi:NAD+ synthase (glutamine-hydrolysing)